MALAAGFVPLVAIVGLSVDAGRSYMVRARLSQALDAAALAGGRSVGDNANVQADVTKYFNANFFKDGTGYLGATVTQSPTVPSPVGDSFTISSQATLPTTFMQLLTVGGLCTTCSSITVEASATITRSARGMELALVLDNTGSMASNNKMTALKDAATSLVNQLYGSADTQPNLYVSVVPFVAQVNVGNQHSDWTVTPSHTQYTVSDLRRGGANSGTGGSSGNPYTYTACATTSAVHDFKDGMLIDVSGASQSAYNGRVQVRTTSWPSSCAAGSNKFWYVLDNGTGSAPATPATGTIKAQRPPVTFASGGYTQSNGAWRGCVEARNDPYETTSADAGPTTQAFNKAFWPSTQTFKFYDTSKRLRKNCSVSGNWCDNDWSSGSINEDGGSGDSGSYGPNKGCPALTVAPLQQSKQSVLGVINGMTPWYGGGTNIPIGLAWGWRALSPNYRGLWGDPTPANLPLDYDTENMEKVLVLLTDGVNEVIPHGPPGCDGTQGSYGCAPQESDYTAYGRLTEGRMGGTTLTAATTEMNSRITTLCTAIKAKGVKIYTIILQENDNDLKAVFTNCASKPEYAFHAPSSSDLAGVFNTIGNQLSSLRLSK
ncbi:MAG: pilus assembly protein TadG-related protein [Alphaproteobacteria bacterium]|nr:pilus assembly protein TadG-related protein [Alphaproteobacteria bacterium]